jgi:hypothetical protein
MASEARSGCAAAVAAEPSASVTMTVSPCDTMSCISRAMRERSATAASRACWSLSRASCSARSSSATTYRRRLPMLMPTSTTMSTNTTNEEALPMVIDPGGTDESRAMASPATVATTPTIADPPNAIHAARTEP